MEAITIKLADWIASQRHKKYQCGVWDCITHAIHWVNFSYGTTNDEYLDCYKTHDEAVQKYNPNIISEFFAKNGFEITMDEPKDGDILMELQGNLESAWIYFNNYIYCVVPQRAGYVKLKPNYINDFIVWRKNV